MELHPNLTIRSFPDHGHLLPPLTHPSSTQRLKTDAIPSQRAFCGGYPANPPPTRLTYNSPELTFSGHKTNALGDPIGFETTALGMDPEEAYWFGVQGVQEYAEHHEAHERGWHKEMDGFIRGDETGTLRCLPSILSSFFRFVPRARVCWNC